MRHYPPPLVLVEWLDSKRTDPGWEHLEGILPFFPARRFSVGFLTDNQKDYKTLAQSLNTTKDNAQVIGQITIPACAIVRLTRLSEPYRPRRLRSRI